MATLDPNIPYEVTFPGPVGGKDGLAATVIYVHPALKLSLEEQIGYEVRRALRIGQVLTGTTLTCDVTMTDEGVRGTGTLWRRGRRVGVFHLKRLPSGEVSDGAAG